MRSRYCLALSLAVALQGCQLFGGGKATGGDYKAKVSKIQAATKALSLSKNEGLSKASRSMQDMGKTLSSSSFKEVATALSQALPKSGVIAGGAGNIIAGGAGNVISGGAGNVISGGAGNFNAAALMADLQAAAMRDSYRLAGVAASGDTKGSIEYDDVTREVTRVSSPDTDMKFDLKIVDSKTRTLDITLVKSPDGTTGTCSLTISSANWVSNGSVPTESGASAPKATSTPAPFVFFRNEHPDTFERFSFALSVVPKGDAKLKLSLTGEVDDIGESFLGASLPRHAAMSIKVPEMSFSLDGRIKDKTLAFKGVVDVTAPDSKEKFNYQLTFDTAKNEAKGDVTMQTAKVKLAFSLKAKAPGDAPAFTGILTATEDGSKLATLEPPTAAEPHMVTLKYTDGTTTKWELFPKDFLPTAGAPVPVSAPSPRRTSSRPS